MESVLKKRSRYSEEQTYSSLPCEKRNKDVYSEVKLDYLCSAREESPISILEKVTDFNYRKFLQKYFCNN